jgi:5-methylcytosine-specific restriction endonuclease McrA
MPYKDRNRQLQAQRDNTANRYLIRRITVIEWLGGKCCRCSISDYRVLQIDHRTPILRKAQDILDHIGNRTIRDIYNDVEDIDNLQVLCANCHTIKSYYEDIYKNKI